MIFKTFSSDIDNMSSRWGMFGKSFSDIGNTITTKWKQVTDYIDVTNDATISGMMSAWKGSSSLEFLSDDSILSFIDKYNKALDSGAEKTANFFKEGTGNQFADKWFKQLNGAPAMIDDYKAAVGKAELAQKGLTASMVASKVAAMALNVAISIGVSVAISALIKVVDNLVHANEKAIESAQELRDKYADFKDTNASNVKTLNDLKDEFEELSDGVSQYGDNISLTTEQYARYQEIVQQIVGMSPSLAEGYDTENGYIADKNGLLERAIELQEIEYRNELRKITNLDNLKTSMSGYIAEYKEALNGGYITEEGNIVGTTTDTDFKNSLWQLFNTNNRENYDGQSMARDIMESLGVKDIDKEIQKYINEYGYWQDSDFWNDYCDQIANNLDAVTNSLSAEEVGLDDTVFDQNIEKLESCAEKYNDMKDSVKVANESIQTDLGYIAEYADGYSELSSEQQKFVTDYLKGFDISDITSTDKFGNLVYDEDKMASVKSQIKDFVESLSKDDSIKQTLTELYAPQADNETIDEYKQRIDSALQIIRKYCEDNKIEIPVGLSDIENDASTLQNNYDQTIKNAQEKYNVTMSEDDLSAVEYYNKATESAEKYRNSLDDIYKSYNGINNIDRDIIYWDDESLEKYKGFIDSWGESAEDLKDSWSTVLGSSENIDGVEVAFTAMLQTDHGLVPLEQDTFWQYFDGIFNQSWNEDGTFDAEKFIQLDKEGTDMVINGQMEHVANMIAAAEGQYMNGVKLTADDVIAIGTPGYDENGKDLMPDNNSKYKGKSMHEVQEWALENRYALAQLDEQAEKTGTSVNELIAEAGKYDDNTDWESWFAENVHTQEDIDNWRKIQQACNDATEAKKKYLETPTSDETPISFTDAISQIQALSKGLDQLDKIYADVKDKEDFDWSSILNNDNFKEAFGNMTNVTEEYRSAYDDFIKTISNSPDDIDTCQDSFNKLATAYIQNLGVLNNLNEENKQATISMLEQMGIANAEEVVTTELVRKQAELEAQKYYTAKATNELKDATLDEYIEFLNEADMSDTAKQALAKLELQKIAVNNVQIETSRDIDRIYALAEAAGASAIQLAKLADAKAIIEKYNTVGLNGTVADLKKYEEAQSIIKSIEDGTYKVDLDFKLDYKGGSSTKKATDSAKKSAKEAEETLKDYIEAYMNFQEKSLDAGKIDFKTYSDNVATFLRNMFNQGKISAKDYYDYTEKMLNKQQSVYQSALKGITSILDKEIESWEKKIDAINDKLDELNQIKDNYDSILSAVDDVYQTEIDNLNNQKDLLQDKIDSLNDEADAYDLIKRKQEALYNLQKAQEQRTKKIYIEGKGFVYRQDQEKVREAQENLKDIENEEIIKRLQDEQSALDDTIDSLEKYRDLWKEIPDIYKQEENQRLATSVLGQNYEQTILLNRISDIENFRDKYTNIQSEINSNEELIKSFEEKKDYYSKLKEQWESITSAYDDNMNYQYAKQLLGASLESDILSGRLDVLNNFRNQYISIQQALADAAWNSANEQIKAAQEAQKSANGSQGNAEKISSDSSSNGSQNSSVKDGKWYVVDSNGKKLSGEYKTSQEAQRHAGEYVNLTKNKQVSIKEFHNGLEQGLVGSHSLNDDFDILQKYGLRRLTNDETLAILQRKEAVLTEEQINNVAEALRLVPIKSNINIPDYGKIANNISNNQQPTTISFGDIHLHGVQNVDGFADAIVKYMPGKMLQAIHKR